MDFTLGRTDFQVDGIFGNMVSNSDSTVSFAALEHAYPIQPDGMQTATFIYQPKIPKGTYTCKRRLSPKFGYDVFWLTGSGVDDHFYEIHRGNFENDSDGCILLGASRNGSMIVESEIAFDKFMALQSGVDAFELTVY